MYPGGGYRQGGHHLPKVSPGWETSWSYAGALLLLPDLPVPCWEQGGGHQRTFPRVTASPAGVTATGLSPPRRGWILPPGGLPGWTGSAE